MTIETPDELLANSKRRLQVADHFLTQTYQYVKDPKILVNVLEGILAAVQEMVDAVLVFERSQGAIPAYHEDSFAAKLHLFKGDLAKKYGFTHIDLAMMAEMQELMHEHKSALVEFQRKEAYVMANDHFKLSTLTIDKIKTYLTRTKTLYTKIHDGITRHTTLPQ